jgi:aryl-alcohol dehydrogenase-like predicted oxidoreductase
MTSKIALGTVQFGLDYGINNISGKVVIVEIKRILQLAQNNGISFIDTAYLYGDSENRLGESLALNPIHFNIISKLPKCTKIQIKDYFYDSLKRLNVDSIYGYLFHNFETFLNDESTLDELLILKGKGKVKKIGFSLYYPYELEILFKKAIQFDLIQIPYNLLDRRFGPYFSELKNKGIEIHVRSIFLQGLFFKNYNELDKKLLAFKNFLMRLNEFAKMNEMHLDEIALGFVLSNSFINKAVVGIDNYEQLSRLILSEKNISSRVEVFSKIDGIILKDEIPEELLIPSNWN